MPSRSSPGSVSGTHVIVESPPLPGAPYFLQGPFTTKETWLDSVTFGNNIPGWRDKLKNGQSATTTMNGVATTARVTNGHSIFLYKWGGQVWKQEMTGSHNIWLVPPAQDPLDLDDARSNAEALGKFNQSIRSVYTALEGGVVVGELGQTLRMIKNPAQGLRRSVDAFHDLATQVRKRFPATRLSYRKVAEALSDLWLEAQFGWRPLLNDVKDGCDALDKLNTGRPLSVRRVTGRSESKVDFPWTHSSSLVGITSWGLDERVVGTVQTVYRGAVRVEALSPGQMDARLFGFDLASFVPTAWELIPYSFLIDYFSNVGDIITGWSNLGVNIAWCNRTSRRSIEKTVTSREQLPRNSLVTSVTFAPAKYVCTKRRVLRTEYTGTTVPGFVLQVPSLGSLKWLNIAALIVSRNSDRQWRYD